jgi:hypothetical protein
MLQESVNFRGREFACLATLYDPIIDPARGDVAKSAGTESRHQVGVCIDLGNLQVVPRNRETSRGLPMGIGATRQPDALDVCGFQKL